MIFGRCQTDKLEIVVEISASTSGIMSLAVLTCRYKIGVGSIILEMMYTSFK